MITAASGILVEIFERFSMVQQPAAGWAVHRYGGSWRYMIGGDIVTQDHECSSGQCAGELVRRAGNVPSVNRSAQIVRIGIPGETNTAFRRDFLPMVIPPEEYKNFIDFCREIDTAEGKKILLEKVDKK